MTLLASIRHATVRWLTADRWTKVGAGFLRTARFVLPGDREDV